MKTSETITAVIIASIMAIIMIGTAVQANAEGKNIMLYTGEWACTASTDSDKAFEVDGKNITMIKIQADGKIYYSMLCAAKIEEPTVHVSEWASFEEGAVEGETESYIGLRYSFKYYHEQNVTIESRTTCIGQLKDPKYGYVQLECLQATSKNNSDNIIYDMQCIRSRQHID